MPKVQIFLGSKSDLKTTEKGIEILKKLGVSFSLRIASAHRTPEHVHKLVSDFEKNGGEVFICVAGMSAHLGGVVASLTVKPVIAVPISRATTAGLDSLLSISQMPSHIPVATMGFDSSGFVNAALLACEMLALKDESLKDQLLSQRVETAETVIETDKEYRIDFEG